MSKELYLGLPKLTLGNLCIQLVLTLTGRKTLELLHSFITNDMPKELYLGLPKLTLGNLCIQLVLTQAVKYRRYVKLVVLPRPAVDENVVQVDHDRLIQKWSEDFIHQPHKGGWSVRESEGKNKILKVTVARTERCLLDVVILDTNLMIALAEVNLREELGPLQAIEKLIYPRKRVDVRFVILFRAR